MRKIALACVASLLAESAYGQGFSGPAIIRLPTTVNHCPKILATGSNVLVDSGSTCGGGSGDFSGPGSSVNNNFVSFNGTSGKTGKDSGVAASSFALAGAVTPVTGATSVLAANWNANTYYPVTTTGQTITMAVSTGLSNNAVITVDTTFGFSVTLQPNGSDQVCSTVSSCGTAGNPVTIAQGIRAFIWTDAANHIYVQNTYPVFTSTLAGGVPASGGGTTNFLRADGTWVAPGGGAVSSVSNSDGTLTISPTTGTVVASLALGHANAWTATGSAGVSAFSLTGLTYGGTNPQPSFLIQPSDATAATNWNGSGVLIGMNVHSTSTADLLAVKTDGGSTFFRIDYLGNIDPNNVILSGGAFFDGTNGVRMIGGAVDGDLVMKTAGGAEINCLKFGPETTSNAALCPTGTLMKSRLGDNSADAPFQASYLKTDGYTVSTLPSASTAGAGARAYVTDAVACTFLATPTGSGSTFCPIISDGTNWKAS